MKKIITLITLGLLGLIGIKPPLVAQTLATQSIGSSGFVSNNVGQDHINWHVGEVIIGHASGQWNMEQGVYQYFDLANFNTRPDHVVNLFNAYPSPTNGLILINTKELLQVDIISSNGVVVDRLTVDQKEFKTDLSHLADGNYYLVAKSKNQSTKSIKIILIK